MKRTSKKRKYFPLKEAAALAKKKGERTYYAAGKGWYNVRPQKRDFWDIY